MEDLLREERKAAEAKGILKTRREVIIELLESVENSEKVYDHIMSEIDIETLKYMQKAAVQCSTLEEFEEKISNL